MLPWELVGPVLEITKETMSKIHLTYNIKTLHRNHRLWTNKEKGSFRAYMNFNTQLRENDIISLLVKNLGIQMTYHLQVCIVLFIYLIGWSCFVLCFASFFFFCSTKMER